MSRCRCRSRYIVTAVNLSTGAYLGYYILGNLLWNVHNNNLMTRSRKLLEELKTAEALMNQVIQKDKLRLHLLRPAAIAHASPPTFQWPPPSSRDHGERSTPERRKQGGQ